MSSGPIAAERLATTVAPPRAMPVRGDVVQPDQHPPGFPLWNVAEIPKLAASRDVATLSPVNSASPLKQIRRWAGTLSIVTKEQP